MPLPNSKYIFDSQELKSLLKEYKHPHLHSLLQLYLDAVPRRPSHLTLTEGEVLAANKSVGIYNTSPLHKSSCSQVFKLLSLNAGGFGVDSNHYNDLDLGYQHNYCMPKILDYIQSQDFDIVHFQDFPMVREYIEMVSLEGKYQYIFIPQIFLTHCFPKSQDSGLLLLIKQGLHPTNFKLLLHPTGIPKINNYQPKLAQADMLFVNSTLYYDLNIDSHPVTLANTYISPISTASQRLHNINISIASRKPGRDFLITGDFNIYGTETLKTFFGLPANPYSFSINAGAQLLFGNNIPHFIERQKLIQLVNQQGLKVANAQSPYTPSIRINLSQHTPRFVNWLLREVTVDWLLDMAISNINTIATRIDPQPFGDVDHASLIVNWRL